MQKAFLAAVLVLLLTLAPPCAARPPEGASGAAALLFHGVRAGNWKGLSVIFSAELARLLDALAAEGYAVVSPRDFLEWWQGRKELPPRAVVLTFDDGYADVYERAYPVLREGKGNL